MLSSKYKNIVKKALYENEEKNSVQDVINQIGVFWSHLEQILSLPKVSYSLTYFNPYIKQGKNTLNILIPFTDNYKTLEKNVSYERYKWYFNAFMKKYGNGEEEIGEISPYNSVPRDIETVIHFTKFVEFELSFNEYTNTLEIIGPKYYILYGHETYENVRHYNMDKISKFIKENQGYTEIDASKKNISRVLTPYLRELVKPVIKDIDAEYEKKFKSKTQSKSSTVSTNTNTTTIATAKPYFSDTDISAEDRERILTKYKNHSTLKPIKIIEKDEDSNEESMKLSTDDSPNITKDKDGNIKKTYMASSQVRFTPDALVGIDGCYRSISTIKKKVCSTLDYHRQQLFKENGKQETQLTYTMDLLKSKIIEAADKEPCKVTEFILNNSKSNDDSKNTTDKIYYSSSDEVPDLDDISGYLGVWDVETISPMVIVSLSDDKNIYWGEGDIDGKKISSKEILMSLFGGKETFNKALLYFPPSGHPLSDSVIAFPTTENDMWNTIEVSTKGGRNSRGAAASIAGLIDKIIVPIQDKNELTEAVKKYREPKKKFLHSTSKLSAEENINRFINNNYVTEYGKMLFEQNKGLVGLLILMCSSKSSRDQVEILDALCKRDSFYDLDLSNMNTRSDIIHFLNKNDDMKEIITNLLNAQNYDFAQVNCQPIVEGNGFRYKFWIQYPAIFKGYIEFKEPSAGSNLMKFHIMGG